jgi:hypothetical protein
MFLVSFIFLVLQISFWLIYDRILGEPPFVILLLSIPVFVWISGKLESLIEKSKSKEKP